MPRKKRVKGERETISFRDLQVLDFICRFGVVNRTAVQWWAETGRSVTLDRERRLREAGLISTSPADRAKWPAARRDLPRPAARRPHRARAGQGLGLVGESLDRLRSGWPLTSSDPARRSSPSASCSPRSGASASVATPRCVAIRIAAGIGRTSTASPWRTASLRSTSSRSSSPRRHRSDWWASSTPGQSHKMRNPEGRELDPAQQADSPLDPLPLRAQGRSRR